MAESHPDQPQSPHALADRIAELTQQLDESRQTIDALERRSRIDQLLGESEPVDLEAVRLLTEAAVSRMDEPDVAGAVAELKRRKPELFRQRTGSRSAASAPSAMAPRRDMLGGATDQAAAHAAATGDRRDLLTYLRMKRSR